jgi:hypothetical protein
MTSRFVQIAEQIFQHKVYRNSATEFEIGGKFFFPSSFIILRYSHNRLEYAHHLCWDGKNVFPADKKTNEPAYSYTQFITIKKPTEEQFIMAANSLLRQIKEMQNQIKLSKISEDFND